MLNERAAEVVAEFHEWAAEHGYLIKEAWLSVVIGRGWPEAEHLTRKLFAKGRSVDVGAVAARMPSALGRLDQGRLVLTVRGASYHGGSKRYLRLYVAAVRLAIERYRNRRSDPTLAPTDLREVGIDTKGRHRVFERILEGESWALSASGTEGHDRRYRLHPAAALAIGNAKTLPKYLDAQANAWWPAESSAEPSQPPKRSLEGSMAGDLQSPFERGLEWMHPAIRAACESLLSNGHHREAVERAAVVLQDEIRRLARTDQDGDRLMHTAFAPGKPRIVVANRRTQSGQSIQRGTHLLGQGVIAAIRNPTSHRLVEMTVSEAIECLAVMSFIYRKLDIADSRRRRRHGEN
jgi:uncharacterized protein (TIGR02391 family)